MTVFSQRGKCTKAIFLQAVTEVRLTLYKAELQYKDRSDMDKVYVSKKGATILGWSAQSKLVLDPRCNDPVLQTSNIVDQYPEVFEHNST